MFMHMLIVRIIARVKAMEDEAGWKLRLELRRVAQGFALMVCVSVRGTERTQPMAPNDQPSHKIPETNPISLVDIFAFCNQVLNLVEVSIFSRLKHRSSLI